MQLQGTGPDLRWQHCLVAWARAQQTGQGPAWRHSGMVEVNKHRQIGRKRFQQQVGTASYRCRALHNSLQVLKLDPGQHP